MIIPEKPFISDFFLETLQRLRTPVLQTPFLESLSVDYQLNTVDANAFFEQYAANPCGLYSNSEDSAFWVFENMPESDLAANIARIKDKYSMREVFSTLNPEYFFKKSSFEELFTLDVRAVPKPFVIKPVKGIASIGIRAVFSDEEWPEILRQVEKDRNDYGTAFSDTVMNLDSFLLESYIEGQEIAVDTFFDGDANPVIVNIMEHDFATPDDNSDRLYKSSVTIMKKYLASVTEYLTRVSQELQIKNFPMHMEMRITADGEFIPIEINPMRFAGFCTTDIASYAFGINPYECFLKKISPDWENILSSGNRDIYLMGVVDIPRHLDKNKVVFHYDKMEAKLSQVLEVRKMDYHVFPMAAFVFAKSAPENQQELKAWLHDPMDDVIELLD